MGNKFIGLETWGDGDSGMRLRLIYMYAQAFFNVSHIFFQFLLQGGFVTTLSAEVVQRVSRSLTSDTIYYP